MTPHLQIQQPVLGSLWPRPSRPSISLFYVLSVSCSRFSSVLPPPVRSSALFLKFHTEVTWYLSLTMKHFISNS